MAQLFAMLANTQQALENKMDGIKTDAKELREEIKANTKGMKEEMEKMRGEMRQVGQCLQAGKMAPPRVATNELRGAHRRVRTGRLGRRAGRDA